MVKCSIQIQLCQWYTIAVTVLSSILPELAVYRPVSYTVPYNPYRIWTYTAQYSYTAECIWRVAQCVYFTLSSGSIHAFDPAQASSIRTNRLQVPLKDPGDFLCFFFVFKQYLTTLTHFAAPP